MSARFPILWLFLALLLACEPEGGREEPLEEENVLSGNASSTERLAEEAVGLSILEWDNPPTELPPFASEVISFVEGEGAGFGRADFPEVVLGPPPESTTPLVGSIDVLSLGTGGEIVLGFEERVVVDGPGADFIVFENAFWASGDPAQVFEELGEVSVSQDGETWFSFACDTQSVDPGVWPGCAGWNATMTFAWSPDVPLNPDATGGDPFDLAELGLSWIRYIRIRDRTAGGPPPSAGFDLDAVGLVWWEYLYEVAE